LEKIQKTEAKRGGFSLIYKGKPLLSLVDPEGQAKKLLAGLTAPEEGTLYFFISPVFGYGLREFAEKLPESSAVLCVEAEKELFEFSAGNLPSGIPLLFIQNPADVCCFVRENWGTRFFRRIEPVKFSAGAGFHKDLYDACAALFCRELRIEWGNAITLSRLGRLYIKNFINNITRMAAGEGFSPLRPDAFPRSEKNCFVFGAGPSLDVFLDTCPADGFKNSLVIAVDTVFLPLLQRGIVPDIVVVLEAQHWNLKDFTGARHFLKTGSGKPVLAMDMSALPPPPELFEAGFCFLTRWTPLKIFSRLKEAGLMPPEIPALGSVGLCATELALKISSGNIFVCGLDFAWTLDSFHCRGSPGHLALLNSRSRLNGHYRAETNFRTGNLDAVSKSGGFKVKTGPAFLHYLSIFKTEFSNRPGVKKRLFEIEGPGLPLGLKTLSLKEAAAVLSGAETTGNLEMAVSSGSPHSKNAAAAFIGKEITLLEEFLKIYPDRGEKTEALIGELDYLWAHFPDCAGAGGRRPSAGNAGFFKRVRIEAEAFLKLWRGGRV